MTTEANTTQATQAGVVHYRIDPKQTRFTVQAFAEGLFSAFGHDPVIETRDCSGEVIFAPEAPNDSSVQLTIKASSLSVANDVKEKDRNEIERMMREEVLETANYPEITLVSSRVTLVRLADKRYRATIVGDITLHGVTQKNVWIPGEVTVDENEIHAKGEFPLKQKDYGIKLVSVAGGTLKVKNEVKCSFELSAAREK